MSLSVLDFFTIGIGPSSSHTVGPMRAARRFVSELGDLLARTTRLETHLYGSLALTGKGHGTDKAILLGLEGATPEDVPIDEIPARLERIRREGSINLGGKHSIAFDEASDLIFHRTEALPAHPNGMRFIARGSDGAELVARVFFSLGGGFIRVEDEAPPGPRAPLPFEFRSADDLLRHARESGLSISGLMLRNEAALRPEAETRAHAGADRRRNGTRRGVVRAVRAA
ncbi:MAG TPA: serine dehydratase beta chain, partial [Chthoniobacteraceae bacterium]|nr:serine dehydratase beta chain [Chthoniobacteraceae bacterium]